MRYRLSVEGSPLQFTAVAVLVRGAWRMVAQPELFRAM